MPTKTKAKRASRSNGAKPLLKLDLACGQNKQPNFTGVDIAAVEGVDVVHDLRQAPWPFADESVEEVHCSHFLEHLDGAERIAFMHELYRVLITGGKATMIFPYYSSMRAVQDPTHKWPPVAEASFLYFNQAWLKENRLDHYPITCDFDFNFGYNIPNDVAVRSQEARDFAIRHYWNAVSDGIITLTKRGKDA